MAGSRGAFGLPPAAAFCAVLCIVAFACLPQLAHAASQGVDVFGRPLAPAAASGASDASAPASSTSAAGSATVFGTVTPPVEQKPAFVLPEPVRKVLFAAIVWQGRLNARIEDAASQLRRHDGNAAEWLTLLLMSFGYGVLHAVGPGHGKLVVGTWLGSRNARIAHAVMLSGWTATVQALSAIVLVVGAVWLANAGAGGVLAQAESLEIVSYALLCIAGGWTLWNSLMRRDCCFDPTAVELVPRSTKAVREDEALDAPDTGASLASSSSYLGTKLNPRTRESRGGPLARWSSRLLSRGPSRAVAVGPDTVSPWSQLLATGFAAGVRPCAGAIFVLVASIGAHVPSIGIAATFAMAAGVALTVTLVGLGSVGANRLLVTRSLRYRSRVRNAQRAVAIAGGALIVLFAAAQLALLIGGYIEPTLT